MSVSCECCVWSGRGLCDWPMPRPEKSCRLCSVIVCDHETSRMRRPWPVLGCYIRRENNISLTVRRLKQRPTRTQTKQHPSNRPKFSRTQSPRFIRVRYAITSRYHLTVHLFLLPHSVPTSQKPRNTQVCYRQPKSHISQIKFIYLYIYFTVYTVLVF